MPACAFADFELRPEQRLLLRAGEPQRLGGRAFDLLVALVERRDRLVPKAELMDVVWPRLVVEENNLQVQVLALRKLLGPRAIATVPGRGYRFLLPLLDEPARASSPPPAGAMPRGDDQPADVAQGRGAAAPHGAALIGRTADEAALAASVSAHRLVTLLGAGGVGKSSLARVVVERLAPRFGDGMAWVDLTAVGEAQGVVDAIAAATRAALARGDRARALAAAMAPMRLLLVLDNAEHLLDAVLATANAVHDAAPAVHVLVTSQAPLRLGVEQLYRLEPLALPDPDAPLDEAQASAAVQLFVARVRASDRHFVLDAHNAPAVVSLTRRLDGLPLAIEMAAARVPALSPAQLDSALRERFRVLTTGDRGAPGRQHTLQAAMEWTHALLGAAERAVFRRLAVFVGSFSLQAAQAVCADAVPADAGSVHPALVLDEWQVLDALAVLVDRSLVAPPVGEPPRYRLLETPRAFALRLLGDDAAEAQRVRCRHLAVYRAFFEQAYDDHLWVRQPVAEQVRVTAPEADNGLAALAFALEHDPEAAIALAPGLAQALVRRHAERFGVWQRTERVATSEPITPPVRARWQLGYARFWGSNSVQRSHPHARAAAAQLRAEGHAAGEYRALAVLAGALTAETMHSPALAEEARARLARMLELENPAWPADLRFLRLWSESNQHSAAGRHEEALRVSLEGMALIQASGRQGRLIHETATVYHELMAGHVDAAIERAGAAVQRLRERQRHGLASGLEVLLVVGWLRRGDAASTAQARALAPAVWTAACAFNQQGGVADSLALLAAREGRARAALLLAGYAEAAHRRGATHQLPVFRQCADEAVRLAAAQLPGADGPGRQAQADALRARGAEVGDDAVPVLAFGYADVD